MSTRVTPEEYGSLRMVQEGSLGVLCEYDDESHQHLQGTKYSPFHWGTVLLATPDNRSIVVCRMAQLEIARKGLVGL